MKLSLRYALLTLTTAFLSSLGTGGCAATPRGGPIEPELRRVEKPGAQVEAAAKRYSEALAELVKHDEAHDWSASSCEQVASAFDEARSLRGGRFAHAAFNAGLAHQRCSDDAKARAAFEAAVRDDPSFQSAHAKVALYRFKQDGNADAAIDALSRAALEGKFSDVSGLVDLAAMQMVRDGAVSGVGCKDDMDCAKLNLQRALALDDSYMPAHNQLALYYFQNARKRASSAQASRTANRGLLARSVYTPSASAQKKADLQQLELAALVCTQAIAKNPTYAPIHNTLGLIQNEMGRINNAVAEFGRAAELDPKFFEAQMNLATINLGFRGFDQAQAAYKRAIAVRPNDYDAHLGMAVALRGPIVDDADKNAHAAKLAAVEAELAAAKKIDENRPEAFYNEAIFLHELKSQRESPEESIAALDVAERAFRTFLTKAQGKPEYAAASDRANERLKDIATTRDFLKSSVKPATTPAATP